MPSIFWMAEVHVEFAALVDAGLSSRFTSQRLAEAEFLSGAAYPAAVLDRTNCVVGTYSTGGSLLGIERVTAA